MSEEWKAGEAVEIDLTPSRLEWLQAERSIAEHRARGGFIEGATRSQESLRGAKAALAFASGSLGALGIGGLWLAAGVAAAPLLLGAGIVGAPLGLVAAGALWLRSKAGDAKARAALSARDELEGLGMDLMFAEAGDRVEMGPERLKALEFGRADSPARERLFDPEPEEPSLADRVAAAGSKLKGRLRELRASKEGARCPSEPKAGL